MLSTPPQDTWFLRWEAGVSPPSLQPPTHQLQIIPGKECGPEPLAESGGWEDGAVETGEGKERRERETEKVGGGGSESVEVTQTEKRQG